MLEFERERAVVVHYRGVPIPGQRIHLRLGLLLNFNGPTIKEGFKRMVM